MLAAIIIWSYLAIVLYLYGLSAAWLLQRWLRDSAPLNFPLTVLLGLIVFGTLAAFLSLFMGLSWLAALLLLAGGLLLYGFARPPFTWALRRPSRAQWLAVAVLSFAVLIVLENATHATSNPDTNLYHAQTIRWAETYRAVPGLGNLNGRLAYNSDWLVLNAATSFAFLNLRSFHLIAGLLFLLSVFYFEEGLFGLAHEPLRLSNWLKVLFLPLAFRTLTGEISSPGTDLPVILLTWVLTALFAENVEFRGALRKNDEAEAAQGSDVTFARAMLIIMLPAFIVTLKLSALPLMLVSAWMLASMIRGHQPRAAWTAGLLSLAILLPWLARSVIQSGYLVFPYSQLDLFHLDWRIPASYVDSVREGVIGWARQPNKDWIQSADLPLATWLPAWFAQQTFNQRLMIVAAILSPLSLLFKEARRYAVLVFINYVGIWFWLLTAPNLRFGYGVLLAADAFLAAALLIFIVKKSWAAQAPRLSFVAGSVLLLLLAYTLVSTFDSGSLQKRLLLPLDYRTFRTVPCAAGNLTLSCASAYKQCGYATFPCVPNVPSGVFPRGSSFQDGFYSTK